MEETETRHYVRASELYDPATRRSIAHPSFLAPPSRSASDDDVRAAVEEAGL